MHTVALPTEASVEALLAVLEAHQQRGALVHVLFVAAPAWRRDVRPFDELVDELVPLLSSVQVIRVADPVLQGVPDVPHKYQFDLPPSCRLFVDLAGAQQHIDFDTARSLRMISIGEGVAQVSDGKRTVESYFGPRHAILGQLRSLTVGSEWKAHIGRLAPALVELVLVHDKASTATGAGLVQQIPPIAHAPSLKRIVLRIVDNHLRTLRDQFRLAYALAPATNTHYLRNVSMAVDPGALWSVGRFVAGLARLGHHDATFVFIDEIEHVEGGNCFACTMPTAMSRAVRDAAKNGPVGFAKLIVKRFEPWRLNDKNGDARCRRVHNGAVRAQLPPIELMFQRLAIESDCFAAHVPVEIVKCV